MKHLYVAIFLILFQVSWIRAMEGKNEPTSSADSPTMKEEQTNPPEASTTTAKSRESQLTDKEKLLLEKVKLHRRGTRSFKRTQSASDDDPDNRISLSGEKRQEKEEMAESNPRHHMYWPKKLPHIGSQTPYRFLVNSIPELEYFKEPAKERLPYYKDLIPVRIWNLFRHDIRYPSKETTHGMRTRLKNIRESVFLKLYENKELLYEKSVIDMDLFLRLLDEWEVVAKLSKGVVYVSNDTLNVRKSKEEKEEEWKRLSPEEQSARLKNRKGADEQIKEAKGLTRLGKQEMETTGGRFRNRFGHLMLNTEPEDRLFKFTDCHRTRVSARKFYSAIYGEVDKKDDSWHAPIDTGDEGKDPLLKYDALCGHWKKNYKKSDLNARQLDAFVNGKEIKSVLKGITNILKFTINSITFSDGKLFYESCAFELAWNRETPWCILMISKYLAVYEYLEDLEYYKNDGPDNDMNKKVGCFLFNDMVKRLIGDVDKDKDGNIIWNLHLENGTDKGVISTKTEKTDTTRGKIEQPDSPKEKLEGTESATEIIEEPHPTTGEKTEEPDSPKQKLEGTELAKEIIEEPHPTTGEKTEEPDSPKQKLEGTESAKEIIEEPHPTTGEKTEEPDSPKQKLEGTESAKEITEETHPTGEKTEEPESPEEKLKQTEATEGIPESDPIGKPPKETIVAKEKTDKKELADEKDIKIVTTYFTHLTAILKFITHLRIHVDTTPLTAFNYDSMKHRKWRTARIGAFGTNITILLMKSNDTYFILVLHQERPVKLPGCDDELCRLDVFLLIFQDSIFNCNYEEMCEKHKHRYFSRTLEPFREVFQHTDLSSLSSSLKSSPSLSSSSSFSSTGSVSFRTKEI